LTFTDPALGDPLGTDFPVAVNISLSKGVLASKYPNPFCADGSCAQNLDQAGGYAYLDTSTGIGKIDVEFDAEGMDLGSMAYDKNVTGRFRIVSTDFNGWNQQYVPFMRHSANGQLRNSGGAISGNIMQHGCSDQGEPAFPLLKSRISTWGHGDVYKDGKLFYKNVWMHSMYSNRYRSPTDNAVRTRVLNTTTGLYAASATGVYNGARDCRAGHVEDGQMQFSLVVARWCHDPNPHKAHPATDMDMLVAFNGIEEAVTLPSSVATTKLQ
jgi:hypothetical protein